MNAQHMAHALGIQTIAEGIEDEASAEAMRRIGVDWGRVMTGGERKSIRRHSGRSIALRDRPAHIGAERKLQRSMIACAVQAREQQRIDRFK